METSRKKLFGVFSLLCLACVPMVAGQDGSETEMERAADVTVGFVPPEVFRVVAGDTYDVILHLNGSLPNNAKVHIVSKDERVSAVLNGTFEVPDSCASWCSLAVPFTVKGRRVGRTSLAVHIAYTADSADAYGPGTGLPRQQGFEFHAVDELISDGYSVAVWRKRGVIVKVYLLTTAVFLVLLTFGFGCQLDIDILLQIFKKPIPPLIGFLCQFVVLPLIGFALTQAIRMPREFGFGVITYSCSPGGGTSNVFASVLEGDLTLSLMMTFLSTLVSLGMMPLWMKLLSRFFVDPSVVVIPYLEIVKALLLLTVPCACGIVVKRFIPQFGKLVVRVNKYFSAGYLAFQIVACAAVNPYMFTVIYAYPIIIVALILLPLLGFAAGYVIAYVLRQPHYRALTIALETSVQNIGIPIIMLMYAFPQPDGDLAATFPLAAGYATAPPIILVYVIFKLYRRFTSDKTGSDVSGDQNKQTDVEVVYQSLNDVRDEPKKDDVDEEKETVLNFSQATKSPEVPQV